MVCNECYQKEILLIQTKRIHKIIRKYDEMYMLVEFENGDMIKVDRAVIMNCPNYTEMFEKYVIANSK